MKAAFTLDLCLLNQASHSETNACHYLADGRGRRVTPLEARRNHAVGARVSSSREHAQRFSGQAHPVQAVCCRAKHISIHNGRLNRRRWCTLPHTQQQTCCWSLIKVHCVLLPAGRLVGHHSAVSGNDIYRLMCHCRVCGSVLFLFCSFSETLRPFHARVLARVLHPQLTASLLARIFHSRPQATSIRAVIDYIALSPPWNSHAVQGGGGTVADTFHQDVTHVVSPAGTAATAQRAQHTANILLQACSAWRGVRPTRRSCFSSAFLRHPRPSWQRQAKLAVPIMRRRADACFVQRPVAECSPFPRTALRLLGDQSPALLDFLN